MNKTISALKDWGCDIDGAMARFLNDGDFYVMCLSQILSDENFEALGETLRTEQTEPAFDHAHALKGAIANMGLTPMYDTVVTIVEPLRAKECAPSSLLPAYRTLLEQREKLAALIAANQ